MRSRTWTIALSTGNKSQPYSFLITALLRYLMNLEHDCEVCEYVELCEGRREGVHQNSSARKTVP